MSLSIRALFDGEVLRPEQPLDLEPNVRYQVTIEAVPEPEQLPDADLPLRRYAALVRYLGSRRAARSLPLRHAQTMNRVERFVDTGCWLALLNSRDQYHRRALDLAAHLVGLLVTTGAVLFEVGNALARPPWRALAVTFLGSASSDPNLTIVRTTLERYDRVLALYGARPDKAWGLTDCLSFVVIHERGLYEALSADHEFEQAGFHILTETRTEAAGARRQEIVS